MENNNSSPYHSTNDVWRVVTEQGKAIAAVESGFAEFRARVDGGFASLANQIAGVVTSVENLSTAVAQERTLRRPDTRGWVVAILGMLATVGSIGLLVVRPMQVELEIQEQRQWDLGHQAAYVKGYMAALEKMGHYPVTGNGENDGRAQ